MHECFFLVIKFVCEIQASASVIEARMPFYFPNLAEADRNAR